MGEFIVTSDPLRAEIPFVITYRGSVRQEKAVLKSQGPTAVAFEVPIKRRANGGEIELNLPRPGLYRLIYEGTEISLKIIPREELGWSGELGLTALLVFCAMGVALIWARHKRNAGKSEAGSSLRSGLY